MAITKAGLRHLLEAVLLRDDIADSELGDDIREILATTPELDPLLDRAVKALQGLLNALPSATTHPAIVAARSVISDYWNLTTKP